MVYLFMLTALFLSAPANSAELYLRGEDQSYGCEQVSEVMDTVLGSDPNKNILFFVHGRGHHPEKGIAYLPQFEDTYDLKIIMFHWDSWINTITRPEKNAVAAGENLSNCLSQFKKYKEQNPSAFAERKTFYMSHSMGNIVFQSFMENHYKDKSFPKDLFDTVILSAPDVPTRHHKDWVDRIDFSKKIFINFNKDDFTLIGSKLIDYKGLRFFRGHRLGATPLSKVSKHANYLDLSNLSFGGHEYFLNKEEHPTTSIFKDLFNDQDDFSIPYRRHRRRPNILIFR